ncbi:MAG: RsfS/YbeB/iojap family protein [bacterium]
MPKKTARKNKNQKQKSDILNINKINHTNKTKSNIKKSKKNTLKTKELDEKSNISKINNNVTDINYSSDNEKVKELIDYIIKVLQNKNCFNITVINTTDYITDYFIIATVDNKITLQAISKYFDNDFLIELKNQSLRKLLESIKIKHDGTYESGWVIVDLYYIWIHLFLPDIRDKYSLERLWNLRNTLRNLGDNNEN